MFDCNTLRGLLVIEEGVEALGVFVAYTVAWREEEKKRKELDEIISREVEDLVEYIRGKYTLDQLREDPIVRAYRDFYWRIGVDPTKTRPSSEALVRRVLRNKFPRIGFIVDAGNIASAKTMIPIGLYDTRYYSPPLFLRLSRGGEVFEPIGGEKEALRAGLPVLVDSKGVVLHLYPHRDSRVTMVRSDTSSILIVGAGVPRVPTWLVEKGVRETVRVLEKGGWSSCPIMSSRRA